MNNSRGAPKGSQNALKDGRDAVLHLLINSDLKTRCVAANLATKPADSKRSLADWVIDALQQKLAAEAPRLQAGAGLHGLLATVAELAEQNGAAASAYPGSEPVISINELRQILARAEYLV